jgi:GNAT superfamily N-acetyltransferase
VDGDGPALAAWAIYQHHEGSFDLFVHPAVHGALLHAAIMDEYVAWAEARAREAGLTHLWPWWAMDDDAALLALMRARGFEVTQADPPAPLFQRALDDLPPLRLPEGFTVQAVTTPDAGPPRAQVTYGAFGSKLDWDTYWKRYAAFMGSPAYDGQRDLLVRAPDGRGAAACTIWFDPVNAVGLFEPVATHPDFQRLGLGKAVMIEGMRRMRAAGMRRAELGFDPNNVAARALYTSLGFSAAGYFAAARKAVG